MEDVRLQEKIEDFLRVDYGSGYGYGYGYGDGDGYGDGYGYGSGYGYGDGDGDGSGYGSGSSYGYGYGYGYGDGYGDGDGDGDGDGYGVKSFNGMTVYLIDDIQTILKSVHKNVARGYVLQSDMNLSPCVVVKGNRMFAHGETLRDALRALTDKMFEDMPEDQRIAEFIKEHPELDNPYSHEDLFDWHHRLTGSCEMGRKAFMRDRGLEMSGSSTVAYFIEITRNAYNGSVIQNLEKAYKKV